MKITARRNAGIAARRIAKSSSLVIHSQPASIASAASHATGIRFPRALRITYEFLKIDQWRCWGVMTVALGASRIA